MIKSTKTLEQQASFFEAISAEQWGARADFFYPGRAGNTAFYFIEEGTPCLNGRIRKQAVEGGREGLASRDRDSAGRFIKSKSGSLGEKRRKSDEFKRLAAESAAEALRTIVEVMQNTDAGNADRLRAAAMLLERAYGKPMQETVADDGAAIGDFVIEIVGTQDKEQPK